MIVDQRGVKKISGQPIGRCVFQLAARLAASALQIAPFPFSKDDVQRFIDDQVNNVGIGGVNQRS